MTFLASYDSAPADGPSLSLQQGLAPATPDIRAVHRAIAELRRGTPCLLDLGPEAPGATMVVLAAETAGANGLAELARLGGGPCALLLSGGRARALAGLSRPDVEGGVAAFRAGDAVLDSACLRGLADPTAEQVLPEPPEPAPVPSGAAACIELAKLARLLPAMLVVPLAASARAEGLLRVAAADVLGYRQSMAAGLVRAAEAQVSLEDAPDARIVAFRGPDAGIEHLAILVGRPEQVAEPDRAPLVRIHSECFTGDLLGSLRCDCGPQLRTALRRMHDEGAGILLYLAQEGRGIGLVNKLRAYALQDRGLDTVEANQALGWGADERGFAVAATMLRALGVRRIRLLTNNPSKLAWLTEGGIAAERVSHLVAGNGVNDFYLATKVARFGHLGD